MGFGWRILSGSLRHQHRRLSIAGLAMALGTTLVSGLLNLSGDIGGQVGRELRAYGANILVRPRETSLAVGSGDYGFGTVTTAQALSEADLGSIQQVDGVVGAVPYLYAVVGAKDHPVILAGVDMQAARSLNTWWQVQGRWPEAAGEVLAGVRALEALDLAVGESLSITHENNASTARVVGTLETGGSEDEQLIASLSDVQALSGQIGQVGIVMVSASAADRQLTAMAGELQAAVPEAEVRTLSQFAGAEAAVVNKVRLLLGLVAGLVLIAGALTVAGTFNTLVMERRAEIGLMKALGAAERRVAGLFMAESMSVGLLSGAVGYLAGLALAIAIGRRVFEASITPTAWGLPATLGLAVSVTLMAALLPVRRALAVDPVSTLRGE